MKGVSGSVKPATALAVSRQIDLTYDIDIVART